MITKELKTAILSVLQDLEYRNISHTRAYNLLVKLIEPTAEADANTVLGDDRANYENAIYDLIFAYANKDDNMPHTFEHDAVINGYNLLRKSHQREFAKKIIEDMARLFT